MQAALGDILHAYGINADQAEVTRLAGGLINSTWKVAAPQGLFVLQQVNTHVFKDPQALDANINMLRNHLGQYTPQYRFVAPLPRLDGHTLHLAPGGAYFRLYPYVVGSHTHTVVSSAQQAYEAAAQFGAFTRLLDTFDARQLHFTIPDFHNLPVRYGQFQQALKYGDAARRREAKRLSGEVVGFRWIAEAYESIRGNAAFKVRVIHHDTKISNVLFDGRGGVFA